MKVAVVSTGSPDYLVDIVADGMIRLLGRQNVHIDFKMREGYYKGRQDPGSRIPQIFENFFEVENQFQIEEAEVLVVSNRSGVGIVQDWKKKTGKQEVAVLDGEDQSSLQEEFLPVVKTYFKREYLKGKQYDRKIYPITFAAIPEQLVEGIERTKPVFFVAWKTHPFREKVAEALLEMGFKVVPCNEATMSKASYNKEMSGSLIGVSAAGAGWDTYRYWEVPYFGCMLFSQRLDIVIEHNFVEGEEAEFFSSIDELKVKLKSLVGDLDKVKRLAKYGEKKCMEKHLSIHRAKKVLEKIV